jgi:signal transduction histidine kinase
MVVEFMAAWLTLRQSAAGQVAIGYVAVFTSYLGASLFVSATTSPVQLISVAWLMWLVGRGPCNWGLPRRQMPELVAMWMALALSCTAKSNDTPILAIVGIGILGTALSISLGAFLSASHPTQPLQSGENDPTVTQVETEPLWAQQDSILHDLSNAMTASLFMVRDLSRALDKGTEPGLRRARSLSQELVGELSQIGEHIASSRQSVRLQPVDSATIFLVAPAERCLQQVARQYPNVHCRFECDEPASEAQICLSGGAATLKRILENLVINACQAERSTAEKEATCRICATDSTVTLTVEDNGSGFPNVVLNSFPSPRVSTKAQGSGMGLYSCHQLVVRDGGTLNISNPGAGGARVTISWPRTAAARQAAVSGREDSEIAMSGTRVNPYYNEPETTAAVKTFGGRH